jgi:hypothetical protein
MKIFFNLFTLLFFVGIVNGQIAEGGFPVSLQDPEIETNTIKGVRLNAPNLDILRVEDNVNDAIKGRLRIGTLINSNIQFSQEAEHTLLEDGRNLFRLAIHGKDAQALNFYFKNFEMPVGDQFFIYNKENNQVLGAYTSANNTQNKVFSTEFVYGESAILEYVQSSTNREIPNFVIEEVGYAYRNVYSSDISRDFGDSDNCEVNANCSEGNNWTDQKKSVIRILVRDKGSLFWCTGTTMNNERKDCTPYLLTAEHCGQTASASDINQWIFYFQYEAPSCANPSSEGTLASRSLTGATLKAQSNDNGGDTGSDMMLLELNSGIPDTYTPYYAGWSKSTIGALSGVGIHHPSGDIKKISTFSLPATTGSFGGITSNTHWDVRWVTTANGHGVTEQGSSGSALFDQNGRLVGTLTGGAASCSNTTGEDEYGKFSYHWTSNGTGTNRQLKSWLDPDNTGVTTIDGSEPCNTNTLTLESAPEIRIFPNPTNNVFVIEWSNTTSIYANVRILNIVGQELGRWNDISNHKIISLDNFTNGIYLIELELDEQIVTKKLILSK